MLLLLLFFLIEVVVFFKWALRRRNNHVKNKIEAHPQLPNEIVTEILRYTFYIKTEGKQLAALRCTEVCKQWKKVIEQDLAHEWIDRIRIHSDDDQEKKAKIEESIRHWKNILKLAPKSMSYLLRRRLSVFTSPTGGSVRPHRMRREPMDVSDLPTDGLVRLPSWQVWHSGTSDPFEPIKYLKTCIFEPEWFTLFYTRQKKKFLSIMDSKTVTLGGNNYAWWFLLLHLLFIESLISIWILAWRRGDFLTNLWIPESELVTWKMSIYYFVNFFAFINMEISIGVWAAIPVRLSSAICLGILIYGVKYILKSVLLMTLAYAIGGIYYILINRDRPIAELMACFAFILVYPALGIMIAICLLAFPWEDKPGKYFLVGLGLHFFSYLFYDPTINFFWFILEISCSVRSDLAMKTRIYDIGPSFIRSGSSAIGSE